MKIKHRSDLWKVVTIAGSAAEIGVAEGYFSAEMLSWPILFPRVYMVDRWRTVATQRGDASHPQEWHDKNFEAARARVAQYGERAVMLRGDSILMVDLVPDDSLALLYIDGDHSYDGVLGDVNAWRKKVKKGGIIAFHDYLAPEYGVNRAVNDYAKWNNLTVIDIPENHCWDAGAYFVIC